MNKMLKIEYPIVSYQSLISDLFAVMCSYDYFDSWICNNYNQLVYIRNPGITVFEGSESMGFFYEHQPKEYQNMYFDIPMLQTNKINFSCIQEDIVIFMLRLINNEYYIRLPINMAETKMANETYMHMVFVYGYDSHKKVFYVANYHNKERYNFYEYSYDEMRKGFENRVDDGEEYLSHLFFSNQ